MSQVNLENAAYEMMGECVANSVNCETKVRDYLVQQGMNFENAQELANSVFNQWVDIYTD